jgi:hypothetical protein
VAVAAAPVPSVVEVRVAEELKAAHMLMSVVPAAQTLTLPVLLVVAAVVLVLLVILVFTQLTNLLLAMVVMDGYGPEQTLTMALAAVAESHTMQVDKQKQVKVDQVQFKHKVLEVIQQHKQGVLWVVMLVHLIIMVLVVEVPLETLLMLVASPAATVVQVQ